MNTKPVEPDWPAVVREVHDAFDVAARALGACAQSCNACSYVPRECPKYEGAFLAASRVQGLQYGDVQPTNVLEPTGLRQADEL